MVNPRGDVHQHIVFYGNVFGIPAAAEQSANEVADRPCGFSGSFGTELNDLTGNFQSHPRRTEVGARRDYAQNTGRITRIFYFALHLPII